MIKPDATEEAVDVKAEDVVGPLSGKQSLKDRDKPAHYFAPRFGVRDELDSPIAPGLRAPDEVDLAHAPGDSWNAQSLQQVEYVRELPPQVDDVFVLRRGILQHFEDVDQFVRRDIWRRGGAPREFDFRDTVRAALRRGYRL